LIIVAWSIVGTRDGTPTFLDYVCES